MILWIAIATCSALALAGLIWPLLRGRAGLATRSSVEMAIYRDQLSEVRREAEQGLLDAQELEAASAEIARRMLSLEAGQLEAVAPRDGHKFRERGVAVALALIVLAAALGMYLVLGSPESPDYPLAARETPADPLAQHEGSGSMNATVSRLEAKLRDAPDNLEGWVLIARSYSTLGRHAEAANAYRRAAELSGGRLDFVGNRAESLFRAAGGQVTSQAAGLFQQVNRGAPGDARARYYLALAEAQAGDGERAVRLWLALEVDSASDAPWLPALRQRIEETARSFDLDLAGLAPSRPAVVSTPDPSAEEVAAAEAMGGEERLAMIRGMVQQLASRLEEYPNDLEGWLRLVRSYVVLGETAKAHDALRRSALIAAELESPLIGQIRETAAQLGIELAEQQPGSSQPSTGGGD